MALLNETDMGHCKKKKRMVESLDTRFGTVKPGTRIRITKLEDPFDSTYPGREGIVKFIDDAGQLHGSWGFLAVVPESDEFIVLT